jgi:hypothetical protein
LHRKFATQNAPGSYSARFYGKDNSRNLIFAKEWPAGESSPRQARRKAANIFPYAFSFLNVRYGWAPARQAARGQAMKVGEGERCLAGKTSKSVPIHSNSDAAFYLAFITVRH